MSEAGAPLARSASEPSLRGGSRPASGSHLRAAGTSVAAATHAPLPPPKKTNLYDRMEAMKLFTDRFPAIRPSGRSITVMEDTAAMDVQPEIYFPAPPTPVKERRWRTNTQPGEICVHPGLIDQRLPPEGFCYGRVNDKGSTTEAAMKAGQKFGNAAQQAEWAERVYASTKMEPLGRAFVRGHVTRMHPKGFGVPSGEPEDCKATIFPVDMKQDSEEVRKQYEKTHGAIPPGVQIDRKYTYPKEVLDPNFRFGEKGPTGGLEGKGVYGVMHADRDPDGSFPQTRLVKSVCVDFRSVQNAPMAASINHKQGKPKVPLGFQFGVPSKGSGTSAQQAIEGSYSLEEQLPDQDLGRCLKPGRRNFTKETRAFGVPSVRTDLPAPPRNRRSVADQRSFGDDASTAALLNPQRFDSIGVPDREFLIRRPKEELRGLTKAAGIGDEDFERLWTEVVALFKDGQELASLDSLLYAYSGHIDAQVRQRLGALG